MGIDDFWFSFWLTFYLIAFDCLLFLISTLPLALNIFVRVAEKSIRKQQRRSFGHLSTSFVMRKLKSIAFYFLRFILSYSSVQTSENAKEQIDFCCVTTHDCRLFQSKTIKYWERNERRRLQKPPKLLWIQINVANFPQHDSSFQLIQPSVSSFSDDEQQFFLLRISRFAISYVCILFMR